MTSDSRDIPIGVSLYCTPTGTAYIEQLVESQKSTRTATKGNTVLSKVSFIIYDLRTDYYNAMNAWGCLYMPYYLKTRGPINAHLRSGICDLS